MDEVKRGEKNRLGWENFVPSWVYLAVYSVVAAANNGYSFLQTTRDILCVSVFKPR